MNGVLIYTCSCAPMSQVSPAASLSLPAMSIFTPPVVPKSTPASLQIDGTALEESCANRKSSEVATVEINAISAKAYPVKPVESFAFRPKSSALYAESTVLSERLLAEFKVALPLSIK